MEGPRVIILDFDGTIVDSFPIFISCVNMLSAEFGYQKMGSCSELREKTAREILNAQIGLSEPRLSEWVERFKALLQLNMREAATFGGMREVLTELYLHYRIGIVTSNTEEMVRHILKRDGIEADFIFSEAPLYRKDKSFKEILCQQGLAPDETIYIGDEAKDVDACRKIGMKIIGVCWGFDSKDILERKSPDYLVESPEELLKLLVP